MVSEKTFEIPTGNTDPQSIVIEVIPTYTLDELNTKPWCQPIGGHVLHPTDSHTVNKLGLDSSLATT